MIEPLVSVPMITYNHAPYIAQAIEGVLQQKVSFPIELVIGEDFSTDGTREIVFEYQKQYSDIIRVITSDKNIGAKKNSYRTMKSCRGKYVAFCEGDDYWHYPLKVQKQADYLETHPECGLVFSSYDVHHVKSQKRIKDFINYKKWEIPEYLDIIHIVGGRGESSRGILTCTVMARRSLCEQVIESDPYLHQSERFLMGDTQTWAGIAALAKVHYMPGSVATYNVTDESATRGRDITKRLRFSVSNAEMLLYLCDKYNISKTMRKRFTSYWCNSSLRLAFHTRNTALAEEARRKAANLGWKQWLQYYGAKNPLLHHLCRFLALFRDSLNKKGDEWS